MYFPKPEMDFNMKKLVREAGTALSRVVQLTEEKVEDFLFEKIEKKRPNRLSNLEYLGLDMIEAGNEFGPGTAYGSALIKVGHCEQKLGQAERDFISSASHAYVQPLRKFLDGEMKTILKERSLLESKRLDLDACKNRLRKARSMQGQQSAEKELRVAQSEFDRQAEITKLLLEGVSSSHAGHLRSLHEFVETQVRFFAQCHSIMQDLQRDVGSLSMSAPGSTAAYQTLSLQSPETNDASKAGQLRARVLYDYDAKDATELSLLADEVSNNSEIKCKCIVSLIEFPSYENYLST
ncbi:Endophilin-B1 [Blattella germanica]|nr:Endophilin-B1 [Blattella germanica]